VVQLTGHLIFIAALFVLTGYRSYRGDDDVVYDLYRGPTPHEGIVRIRWVLLKTFTSIYGSFVPTQFRKHSLPRLSKTRNT
jgi:hypothetical protein